MIDPRLAPFHSVPKVPLYPEVYRAYPSPESPRDVIETFMTAHMRSEPGRMFLGASGTAMLLAYFRHRMLYRGDREVAIPSFSCPELYAAALHAGLRVFLYELSDRGELTFDSIKDVVTSGVRLLVWPLFFCYTPRPQELLDYAHAHEVSVIYDEAQSFPLIYRQDVQHPAHCASLISFGRSKKLSCSGGGAIVLYEKSMQNYEFDSTLSELVHANPFPVESSPKASFTRLDELLAFRGVPSVSCGAMPHRIMVEVAAKLAHYRDYEVCLGMRFQKLREFVVEVFGESALLWTSDYNVPSTFGLQVVASRRFEIMDELRKQGVQTTWYYYPLHVQPHVRSAHKSEFLGTNQLASSILILPCKISHSLKDINYVGESLWEVKRLLGL